MLHRYTSISFRLFFELTKFDLRNECIRYNSTYGFQENLHLMYWISIHSKSFQLFSRSLRGGHTQALNTTSCKRIQQINKFLIQIIIFDKKNKIMHGAIINEHLPVRWMQFRIVLFYPHHVSFPYTMFEISIIIWPINYICKGTL